MYKRQIPPLPQQPTIESKTSSVPYRASVGVQPPTSVELAPPSLDQSIESFELPTPLENWSASSAYPSPCTVPQISQWQEELREIGWELDLDVWESCPYD